MTNNIAKIRAALELAERGGKLYAMSGLRQKSKDALAALAELEKSAAEPVAWMWNDELGIPHASAGSKKPVWLESSASAEYIKKANLRPLYAAPPAPVVEIREPTPEEYERIRSFWIDAEGYSGRTAGERMGRSMFDAVCNVMWPKSEAK